MLPFIYRVHENPDFEKVKELNKFLFNFGLKIKANADNIYPQEFAKILKEVKGKRRRKSNFKFDIKNIKSC